MTNSANNTPAIWQSKNRTIARHSLVKKSAELVGAAIVQKIDAGSTPDCFIGWGQKTSGTWAMKRAAESGAAFQLFEDGFIRSLKPGYAKPGAGALYSLIADSAGIYYDGNGNSDLVSRLNDGGSFDPVEAEAALARYRETGASKYNWYPGEYRAEALENSMPKPGALVIDQTLGDAAVKQSGLTSSAFETMLRAALDENPGKPVYFRAHPDRFFRNKRSCLPDSPLVNDSRVHFLDADLAPWQLFQMAEKVYVGSSLLGVEALLHGCPVVTFGRCFYSGWGVTDDRHPDLQKRDRTREIWEIFAAAFLEYSRYFDPDTREPCDLMRVLDHLELQKRQFSENARTWVCFRMSPWKRTLMNRYLASPAGEVKHTHRHQRARKWLSEDTEAVPLVWGRRTDSPLEQRPQLIRVEDGFLRSVGLGADFHMPLSLIFDATGIYFDPEVSSDLEKLLQNHKFTHGEIAGADHLIKVILKNALTKYNLRGDDKSLEAKWPLKDVESICRILVPGQVEGDASIQWGSPQFRKNADFLRAVREENPEAIIAYKPHPDVVKHLRIGDPVTHEIELNCDVVVRDLDILPWLETCHEVHTLTSLSGFEGLLRGKKVVCYGLPFYAAWGLTEDRCTDGPAIDRRARASRRSLAELVAAALVLYPRYLNPATGEFTTAIRAAELIAHQSGPVFSRPWYARIINCIKTRYRSIFS